MTFFTSKNEVFATLTGYTQNGLKKRLKSKVTFEEVLDLSMILGKYGEFDLDGTADQTAFEKSRGIFNDAFKLKSAESKPRKSTREETSEENDRQSPKRRFMHAYETDDSDETDIDT